MDPQVRHCPPRRHCPGFRGEKIRGHTGAACSSTEDHPISFRRQTSRPGCTETQVQKSKYIHNIGRGAANKKLQKCYQYNE